LGASRPQGQTAQRGWYWDIGFVNLGLIQPHPCLFIEEKLMRACVLSIECY
jgi:hypothetical protein